MCAADDEPYLSSSASSRGVVLGLRCYLLMSSSSELILPTGPSILRRNPTGRRASKCYVV